MKRAMIAALLTVTAVPAAAQQRGMSEHRMGPGMESCMMAMQEMKAFAPEQLLARRDSLALTPAQIARLTALAEATKSAHAAAHREHQTHMDAQAQAFRSAAPDTTVLQQHFRAAHDAMGKAHALMLGAAAQAKAILTEAQQARVSRGIHQAGEHDHNR